MFVVFGVGRESLGVVGCVGDEGVLRGGLRKLRGELRISCFFV